MNNPPVKGDEVRQGTQIYLDAASKEILGALPDEPLSEFMLHQLNDASLPLYPTSARQIGQREKEAGELVFAVRLRADKTCIGICRLSDVGWQARHAQLHVSLIDEAHFTVDVLADVIQTLLQFAYWEANLNRIYVHCIEDHTHLSEALERVGFTNEGRLRQDGYRNGRYLDRIIYAMLRREWRG